MGLRYTYELPFWCNIYEVASDHHSSSKGTKLVFSDCTSCSLAAHTTTSQRLYLKMTFYLSLDMKIIAPA